MIIFEGKDLVVKASLESVGQTLVFSFAARDAAAKRLLTPAAKLRGTGDKFLSKYQFPAVFFLSRWNHWWQSPEMMLAIDKLNEMGLFDRYKDRVSYGTSMGGYGALMYSRLLRANRVVAIVPQYSVDIAKMPEENRWLQDSAKIQFIYDDMSKGLISDGQVFALYDRGHPLDRLHVKTLKRHRDITDMSIPYAGHELARVLKEAGVLGRGVSALLRGEYDAEKTLPALRAACKKSPLYMKNIAVAWHNRGDEKRALAFSKKAMELLDAEATANPAAFRGTERGKDARKVVSMRTRLLMSAHKPVQARETMQIWKERLALNDYRMDLFIARAFFAEGRADEALGMVLQILPSLTEKGDGLDFALKLLDRAGSPEQISAFESVCREALRISSSLRPLMASLALKFGLTNLSEQYADSLKAQAET